MPSDKLCFSNNEGLNVMKKSALIFTASFGDGHIQAARALKAECEKNHIDTLIIDLLYELHPIVRKLLTFSYYRLLIHAPSIWRRFYEQKGDRELIFLHKILSHLMQTQLQKQIEDHRPKFIISTHPFVTIMLASLKQNNVYHVPLYAVMTDFKFHPFFLHEQIDHYFTADPAFQVVSQAWGTNVNQVTYSGIPAIKNDEQIDELKEHPKPLILLAGGGQGLMHYKPIIQSLDALSHKVTIICMIGRKLKLEKKIARLRRKTSHKLKIIPFTERFTSYLHTADIIITKAGGLTLTEGLLSQKPMLIYNPLPGHEEDNARFLSEIGACEWVKDVKEIPMLVERLLHDQSYRAKLNEAIDLIKKPVAAETIVKEILTSSQLKYQPITNDPAFFAKGERGRKQPLHQAEQVKQSYFEPPFLSRK